MKTTNLKKTLALILAMTLSFGGSISLFANEGTEQTPPPTMTPYAASNGAVELKTTQGAVTTYASIEAAFANERAAGDVVKLLEDVTLTSDLNVSVETVVSCMVELDLNGKTLYCGDFAIVVNKNTLDIVDNTAVVGKVSGTNAENVILVNNGGDLLLADNVTVENTGAGSVIHNKLGGHIIVNQATVTAKRDYAIKNYGVIEVYNGVITSDSNEAILSVGSADDENAGFVLISGGSVKGIDNRSGKPIVTWVYPNYIEVKPYVFTIPGEENQQITSLEVEPATESYGTSGVVTDSNGAIYVWMVPNRTKVIIKIGEQTYSAAIDPISGGAVLEEEKTTPPTPPTPPTPTGGSDNSYSADTEYDFWTDVTAEIKAADEGDILILDARGYTRMSVRAMDALVKNNTVSLIIRWNGGADITIPAGKAQIASGNRLYYQFAQLAELYQNAEAPTVGVPVPDTTGKVNPNTGRG